MRILPFALLATLGVAFAGCMGDGDESRDNDAATGNDDATTPGGEGAGELNGNVTVLPDEGAATRETVETNATPGGG